MFFNSLSKKLKNSYCAINPEIRNAVFPNGEAEYIYVATILKNLFSKSDVFILLKLYASVYTYFKSTMGNSAKTYSYAQKKSVGILTDNQVKNLIALIMFNLTSSKKGVSDPVAMVYRYREFVDNYLETVEEIKKYPSHFEPDAINAGTVNSPLLVDGVQGIHDYLDALHVPNVEKITYKRTSSLHLTDKLYKVSYSIDEYTLYNAADSSEIATLWFNIYGSRNTDIQPACFSDKDPFSVAKVVPELFAAGVKESQAIEELTVQMQIPCDLLKLVVSTFTYLFVIWTFSFSKIKYRQVRESQKEYAAKLSVYIAETFQNTPYQANLFSAADLDDMWKRVDCRIRESFHDNNCMLVDDGLSEEFLREFISEVDAVRKLIPFVSNKILKDWTSIGEDADRRYLV